MYFNLVIAARIYCQCVMLSRHLTSESIGIFHSSSSPGSTLWDGVFIWDCSWNQHLWKGEVGSREIELCYNTNANNSLGWPRYGSSGATKPSDTSWAFMINVDQPLDVGCSGQGIWHNPQGALIADNLLLAALPSAKGIISVIQKRNPGGTSHSYHTICA